MNHEERLHKVTALLEAASMANEMEGTYAICINVKRAASDYTVEASLHSYSNEQTTEYKDRFTVSTAMTVDEVDDAMDHLRDVYAEYQRWRAESEAREVARERALSKLDAAERAVLGLSK